MSLLTTDWGGSATGCGILSCLSCLVASMVARSPSISMRSASISTFLARSSSGIGCGGGGLASFASSLTPSAVTFRSMRSNRAAMASTPNERGSVSVRMLWTIDSCGLFLLRAEPGGGEMIALPAAIARTLTAATPRTDARLAFGERASHRSLRLTSGDLWGRPCAHPAQSPGRVRFPRQGQAPCAARPPWRRSFGRRGCRTGGRP